MSRAGNVSGQISGNVSGRSIDITSGQISGNISGRIHDDVSGCFFLFFFACLYQFTDTIKILTYQLMRHSYGLSNRVSDRHPERDRNAHPASEHRAYPVHDRNAHPAPQGHTRPVSLIIAMCIVVAGAAALSSPAVQAAGSPLAEMPGTAGLSASDLPLGEISYPVPSPSNPDIIAYTRKDGNRHYLHLYHVTTGADERIVHQTRREQEVRSSLRSVPRNQAEALMRNAGLPTAYFEGDFAWRPGLDQFGYQWFAFVATQAGKTQLHLGYISSGENLRTVVFPVAFGNVVTNPAFSPDGNKLVFSADGQLYIEQDIGRVIRKREFKFMQPRRITGHANGSFFPSWSADGSMIAYQTRPDEGRRTGFETVFVIDVSQLPEGRLPMAHRVSIDDEEGVISRHQRPSWAPSGRLLAWYEHTEHTGEEAAEEENAAQPIRTDDTDTPPEETYQAKKIRLIRVDFDRSRNAWIGMTLQRPARRFFAESVYAFDRTAPHWATIEYDRRPADGILWVRHAPDLEHPLHFSHLDYYADNRADFTFNIFSFSNRFEWLERTRQNRYPAAIQSDGHVRYVYIAREGDRQRLKVVDRQTATIQPAIRMERREVPSVIRSGLYPGWGHFHIGENRRGAWLTGTFTALAGATVTGAVIRYRSEESKPGDALLISLGAATGVAWTFSLIDLKRQFPSYREIPVNSTFEGYRRDITHVQDHEYLTVSGPVKRDAMLLSALYPGLGQIYIGERRKGYILGLTFTALAGSTVAGAAYRYHYPGPTPSNEVLIGLGAATLGTWIFNLIDVQQSFNNNFFASAVRVDGAGDTSQSFASRAEIALAPRVDYLRIGNYTYREYAAIGLSLSF